jgi:hypothetical protein
MLRPLSSEMDWVDVYFLELQGEMNDCAASTFFTFVSCPRGLVSTRLSLKNEASVS